MLSNREKEVLEALKVLGFKYLARDKDNRLCAYEINVYKYEDTEYWDYSNFTDEYGNSSGVDSTLFNMVKWEDDKPTLIDELLTGRVKPKSTENDIMCAKAFAIK